MLVNLFSPNLTSKIQSTMDPNRPFQFQARGNRPTHHHSRFGRAPSTDAVPDPPASTYIPEWKRCGKHNCGNHHYTDLLPLRLDQPVSKHTLHCYGCNQSQILVSLHILPCYHALCRDCLNRMAIRIHETLQTKKAQVDNALANAFLRREIGMLTENAQFAAQMAEEEGTLFRDAGTMAGYTCCGQPMRLASFLYCMDPGVALIFWQDFEYMLAPQDRRNHCGWPDCRAFVPNRCGFTDTTEFGPDILHCPTCKGNGQLIYQADSDGELPGKCNVWIPAGQPMGKSYTGARV
ncbi:hypothetical protein BR93DRAFT_325777 [Coniochaeta sp. PMI_546]|nr:hypothetical protein BR93DRAFT_325777 [Coniochaeta sp. PMI_546]